MPIMKDEQNLQLINHPFQERKQNMDRSQLL